MALINNKTKKALSGSGVLLLAGLASLPLAAQEGHQLLRNNCGVCHAESGSADNPVFSRISEQRKSPEGWLMTINRMVHLRDVEISADDKRNLVRYLADTQGLAPDEAAPFRYLLEQDTNLIETGVDAELVETCARCHSGARFALQRRTEQEWQYLVDFHMGQFPTTELHALSRDRAWYEIARNQTASTLALQYALDTPEWSQWQSEPKADVTGRWRVVGFVPGKGEFDAVMLAERADDGRYDLSITGRYADGSELSGDGKATLYTGYEWRASLTLDGVRMRQVMALDEQGLSGRMFLAAEREIGGSIQAIQDQGEAAVLALLPSFVRKGEHAEVEVIGHNLQADSLSLGAGVVIEQILSQGPDSIRVRVSATGDEGIYPVQLGDVAQSAGLAVYEQVARVDVLPQDAVARIGGGGMMAKVRTAYRVVGYSAGPDGIPGTEDDLRLGYMPASWQILPADEEAEHDQDHIYAGEIDANGIFTPGIDGPNPERRMSANNVGRLTVVATVTDGEEVVEGSGNLLVSVPDFVRRVLD
ncbi:quinohemoprotein amine dehydrogenase subunit alpha [Nitrincola alkalilacustris]|uniref:quinohemoprotein amine dehydrogenase subunit alpha n=1 Tax=Nitrincola alkalilacustris TaxID=1571224 RepID=UPI00124EF235|nr:quinohemoprotein amine dehydrogenase subunit alpha [Nitrincola alkalilacustris]